MLEREVGACPQGGDPRDREGLVPLVAECARTGGGVLVFCASRAACQACAALLADALPGLLGAPSQVPALGESRRAWSTLHLEVQT